MDREYRVIHKKEIPERDDPLTHHLILHIIYWKLQKGSAYQKNVFLTIQITRTPRKSE